MNNISKLEGNKVDLILRQKFDAIPEKGYFPKFVYDIVLHGTNQVVGECDARIGYNDNIFYGGNIGYSIMEEYRGNGYAGQAVELLKIVLKENGLEKMYITNDQYNNNSKRVCEKLDATYLGLYELPEDNELRIADGQTHVNVYVIDL